MENKVRSVFSLGMIVGFMFFAMATAFGPDQSTNTTVAIKDCMDKPPLSGNFVVFIHYKDKSGVPIPNATGTVFLTQQEVKPDSCKFRAFTYIQDLFTDGNGQFVTQGIFFEQKNSEDLWRVEVSIDKSAFFNGVKKVDVVKYPETSKVISLVGLRLDDL